jgi:hypothetical protein
MSVDNSLLPNSQFRVIIGGISEFPKLSFFATTVSIPGVSTEAISTKYRNLPGFTSGNSLTYEQLNCTLLCDEKMTAYLECFNWLKHNAKDGPDIKTTDITIETLTSHFNVSQSFRFMNAFPTSLGSIEFNSSGEPGYASFDISFSYDEFDAV